MMLQTVSFVVTSKDLSPSPVVLCSHWSLMHFLLQRCAPIEIYVVATGVPTDLPAQAVPAQVPIMPYVPWELDSSPWVLS